MRGHSSFTINYRLRFLRFIYPTVLNKLFFPNHYQRINAMYPSSGSDQRVISQLGVTDMVFFCPLRNISRSYFLHFQSSVYLYKFNLSQTYCRFEICL
jgi:hypothetical protein